MADIRTASFDAVSCRACVDVMHGLFFGILQHSPKASPDAGGLQTAPHICSVFRELEHRSVRLPTRGFRGCLVDGKNKYRGCDRIGQGQNALEPSILATFGSSADLSRSLRCVQLRLQRVQERNGYGGERVSLRRLLFQEAPRLVFCSLGMERKALAEDCDRDRVRVSLLDEVDGFRPLLDNLVAWEASLAQRLIVTSP